MLWHFHLFAACRKIKKEVIERKHPFLNNCGSETAHLTSHIPLEKISLLATCNSKGGWEYGLARCQGRKVTGFCGTGSRLSHKTHVKSHLPNAWPDGSSLSVVPWEVAVSCAGIRNDSSILLAFFLQLECKFFENRNCFSGLLACPQYLTWNLYSGTTVLKF